MNEQANEKTMLNETMNTNARKREREWNHEREANIIKRQQQN